MSQNFRQDLVIRNTVKVGNASDRTWTHVCDSHVWVFKPGEVKDITPLMGPRLNEFHAPVPIEKSQARDAEGKLVGGTQSLSVKKGGDTDAVVQNMLDKPGSPLYPILNDGKDPEREKAARQNHLVFHVAAAQKLVDTHRAYSEMNNKYGIENPPMPTYIREAADMLRQHVKEVKIVRKRYLCILDGAAFDYYDEAKDWIFDPITGHQKAHSQWSDYIRDNEGGPHAYRPKPTDAFETVTVPEGARLDDDPKSESGHVPSAAVKKIIDLAAKADVTLPEEIIARLDDANDETAVEDAMTLIFSPGKSKAQPRKARATSAAA